MDTIQSVPFSNQTLIGGFAEVRGVLTADASSLMFEYLTQDNIVKVLKTALQKRCVPIDSIESIEFQSRWFGFSNVLTIRTRKMEDLSGIPGSDQNKVDLSIERCDRARAREFASQLNWRLSEMLLNVVQATEKLQVKTDNLMSIE